MTFAGIVACQVGTAIAARTEHASLRSVGLFTNRLLLWGIASELAFAAAVVYLPPLQHVFRTAPLGGAELAILLTFPGDRLGRRRAPAESCSAPAGAPAGVPAR